MSKIFAVLKKELRRFFTDKRMVMSIFLPGILIFTIYSLLGDTITDMTSQQITDYTVYIENEPELLSSMFNIDGWTVLKNEEALTKEEILSKVSDGSVDLYIIYEEDFIEKVNAYTPSHGKAPYIGIYHNSAVDSSVALYTYVTTYLDQFEAQLANKFDFNTDLNVNYDLATEEELSTSSLSPALFL